MLKSKQAASEALKKPTKGIGVISKSHLDSLLEPSKPQTSKSSVLRNSGNTKRRPLSGAGHKPTYAAAPFKTDPLVSAVGRSRLKVTSSKGQGQSQGRNLAGTLQSQKKDLPHDAGPSNKLGTSQRTNAETKPCNISAPEQSVQYQQVSAENKPAQSYRGTSRVSPNNGNLQKLQDSKVEDSLIKGVKSLSVQEEVKNEVPLFCLAKQG